MEIEATRQQMLHRRPFGHARTLNLDKTRKETSAQKSSIITIGNEGNSIRFVSLTVTKILSMPASSF